MPPENKEDYTANSPGELEIILEYYYAGRTKNPNNLTSEWGKRVHNKLVNAGLVITELNCGNVTYRANEEALKCYVDFLLSIPFPVKRYSMQ